MQLKKNPREGRYEEPRSHYKEEPMTEDTAEMGFTPEPQQLTRPQRRPELETDAPARVATPARSTSVVDPHSSFDGRYETEQDLRVEGTISGEVVCRGLFTIERDATGRAKIQAHDAEIRGRLEGDIVCTGRLFLTSTAIVVGTMTAAAIVVEEGASLSGKVETASVGSAPKVAPATAQAPAPASRITPIVAAEPPLDQAAPTPTLTTRTRREVPSFALVSSDDRATLDRN